MAAKRGKTRSGAAKGRGRARRFLRIAAITAMSAYAVFALAVWCFSDALIFPAPRPSYAVTEPDLVRIAIPGGGNVAALRLAKPGASGAILYFHGNGEDIGSIRRRLEFIREYTGCLVLAPDYPGYGLSPGTPSEASVLRVADAAYDHLRLVLGTPAERIVIWGYSLGSGSAVHLAAKRHVRALILDAPFTSVFRVAIPRRILPFDRFDNLALMSRVQSPVFIAHGERDEVVPFAHGEELRAAAVNAPEARLLPLPDTGHIDIPGAHGAAYRAEILRVIRGEVGEARSGAW